MRAFAATGMLIAALALFAASCGDSEPATPAPATPAPAETATAAATPVPESDLPSVDLINVATGATVNLASFAPSDRPVVLWFWAPH